MLWFTPGKNDNIIRNGDEPLAAIVAAVCSDTCVNLTVSDANGNTTSRCSVRLLQDDDVAAEGEQHCAWMPFQKDQAAKHDYLAAITDKVLDGQGRCDAILKPDAGEGEHASEGAG